MHSLLALRLGAVARANTETPGEMVRKIPEQHTNRALIDLIIQTEWELG